MTTTSNDVRRHALGCMAECLNFNDPTVRYTAAAWAHYHPRLAWLANVVMVVSALGDAARCLPCLVHGDHDLVDEGWGNPESGCIAVTCQRCGYAYPTHWLY